MGLTRLGMKRESTAPETDALTTRPSELSNSEKTSQRWRNFPCPHLQIKRTKSPQAFCVTIKFLMSQLKKGHTKIGHVDEVTVSDFTGLGIEPILPVPMAMSLPAFLHIRILIKIISSSANICSQFARVSAIVYEHYLFS